MERLAADFSADPEEILPEASTLESAKSYREKKAKPLLAKIVQVLRSLYRAYIELSGRLEEVYGKYNRVCGENSRLNDRMMEIWLENKKLRQISADYTRVRRVFGPEEVEKAVVEAKCQEAAEKEQRKAKRKFSRGAR